MSILKSSKYGWYISHLEFIQKIYESVDSGSSYTLKTQLFDIWVPYKAHKIKKNNSTDEIVKTDFEDEIQFVKELFNSFYEELNFEVISRENPNNNNKNALNLADYVYNESGKRLVTNFYGKNQDNAVTKAVEMEIFLFPENCNFYCKDVADFPKFITDKYDLIVLDPPWWNKYIRRKRKKSDQAYNMMYNYDLKQIPLEHYINDGGLVVVWCTNSKQHFQELINEILPKWGLEYLGKWYWVKITQTGEPICAFAQPPRKQPFEQIIFAGRLPRTSPNPDNGKLILSVPSAIHSHKPPLNMVLEHLLPQNPKCLELFARYLLPNWTSYGNEVLKLQHECLYDKIK